jgi:hypothetical protein
MSAKTIPRSPAFPPVLTSYKLLEIERRPFPLPPGAHPVVHSPPPAIPPVRHRPRQQRPPCAASAGRQTAAGAAEGSDANAMRLWAMSAGEETEANAIGAAEREGRRGLPRSGHSVPHDLGNNSIGAQAGGMVEDRRGHHDFVRSGLGYEGH